MTILPQQLQILDPFFLNMDNFPISQTQNFKQDNTIFVLNLVLKVMS